MRPKKANKINVTFSWQNSCLWLLLFCVLFCFCSIFYPCKWGGAYLRVTMFRSLAQTAFLFILKPFFLVIYMAPHETRSNISTQTVCNYNERGNSRWFCSIFYHSVAMETNQKMCVMSFLLWLEVLPFSKAYHIMRYHVQSIFQVITKSFIQQKLNAIILYDPFLSLVIFTTVNKQMDSHTDKTSVLVGFC